MAETDNMFRDMDVDGFWAEAGMPSQDFYDANERENEASGGQSREASPYQERQTDGNQEEKPRMSKEDYRAFKQQEREQVMQKLNDETVLTASDSIEFIKYMDMQSRFPRYSASNVLLMRVQKPEATRVMSFDKWKEAGVRIRSGEKGILILSPETYMGKDGVQKTSFNVKTVFDVSQTDYPSDKNHSFRSHGLKALNSVLQDVIPADVEIKREEAKGGDDKWLTQYDPDSKTLTIHSTEDRKALFNSLATALAYAKLDSEGHYAKADDKWPVAKMFAYMVGTHFGQDMTDLDLPSISLLHQNMKPQEVRHEYEQARKLMNGTVQDMYQAFKDRQEKYRSSQETR